MVKRSHSGRRPGPTATQAAIEDSARKLFAEHGYDRTTVRQVAKNAGVDPGLVTYFFGTKWELFLAVVEPVADMAALIDGVVSGDHATAGRRLATAIIEILADEARRRSMVSMIRAATSEPEAAKLVRQFLTCNILQPIAERLGAEDAAYRASLVMSQISGYAMANSIVGLEPLTGHPRARVAADLGDTLQRYLLGPLEP
ncbi:TetR/AcrR family transcriptional regulator [Mycobacterium sp. Marseille-P9652]|uniref:TetR/AcrR family transcriptional regulator n=1 Tax=Mycobacterium sp. Marseille-P9652 TaxID=2654950 RepID=UPI0012E86B02|nr:TetR family transcriptional regulator [Mycobacterium sp. Marseille-P9652]